MCICFVLCDCLLPTSSPSFYDSVPGIASLASAMNRGRLLRGYTNTNTNTYRWGDNRVRGEAEGLWRPAGRIQADLLRARPWGGGGGRTTSREYSHPIALELRFLKNKRIVRHGTKPLTTNVNVFASGVSLEERCLFSTCHSEPKHRQGVDAPPPPQSFFRHRHRTVRWRALTFCIAYGA